MAKLKTFRELKIGAVFKWYSKNSGFKVEKLSDNTYREINSSSREINTKVHLDLEECYLISQPKDDRLLKWLKET